MQICIGTRVNAVVSMPGWQWQTMPTSEFLMPVKKGTCMCAYLINIKMASFCMISKIAGVAPTSGPRSVAASRIGVPVARVRHYHTVTFKLRDLVECTFLRG